MSSARLGGGDVRAGEMPTPRSDGRGVGVFSVQWQALAGLDCEVVLAQLGRRPVGGYSEVVVAAAGELVVAVSLVLAVGVGPGVPGDVPLVSGDAAVVFGVHCSVVEMPEGVLDGFRRGGCLCQRLRGSGRRCVRFVIIAAGREREARAAPVRQVVTKSFIGSPQGWSGCLEPLSRLRSVWCGIAGSACALAIRWLRRSPTACRCLPGRRRIRWRTLPCSCRPQRNRVRWWAR